MYSALDLSIVVPAYNEEHRIGPTLAAIDRFVAGSDLSYEIVVVDDGSADGTRRLVEGMAASMPALRLVAIPDNRGKGHAVRAGMLASRGQVRVMCDADGATPAEELPKIINPVRLGEVDIAVGSRYAPGADVVTRQPLWRRVWSRIANRVVQATLVGGITDTQCGFKALSAQAARDIFRRCRIDGWAFDLEALALARKLRYSVAEVPVRWADDPRSRVSAARDFARVVREWVAIRVNLSRGSYGELAPARSLASASMSLRLPAAR